MEIAEEIITACNVKSFEAYYMGKLIGTFPYPVDRKCEDIGAMLTLHFVIFYKKSLTVQGRVNLIRC